MPKYRVTFVETVCHIVTFESDKPVDFEDENSWFDAMDRYDPSWFKDTIADVQDRELLSHHEITGE